MGKLCMITLVFFSLAITLLPTASSEAKATKLHFFVHDRFNGTNKTVYKVAQSDISLTSPTNFGLVTVLDDPFTIGHKRGSKMLGRAQGILCLSDLNEIGFLQAITLVFTSGEYNGSTLIVLGRNNVSQKYRHLPIVGGTGAFELARGIATINTYFVDYAKNYSVLEYNVAITQ